MRIGRASPIVRTRRGVGGLALLIWAIAFSADSAERRQRVLPDDQYADLSEPEREAYLEWAHKRLQESTACFEAAALERDREARWLKEARVRVQDARRVLVVRRAQVAEIGAGGEGALGAGPELPEDD